MEVNLRTILEQSKISFISCEESIKTLFLYCLGDIDEKVEKSDTDSQLSYTKLEIV